MDWDDASSEYEKQTWEHGGRLSALPTEWQRELVALRRVSSQIMNGGYLQFFANCGRESYAYASQALKKIGAFKLAAIIDRCQALIDEHFPHDTESREDLRGLLPNEILDREGRTIKEPGSVLPESVLARVSELSREFIDLPDDLGPLAQRYYREHIEPR